MTMIDDEGVLSNGSLLLKSHAGVGNTRLPTV